MLRRSDHHEKMKFGAGRQAVPEAALLYVAVVTLTTALDEIKSRPLDWGRSVRSLSRKTP
jgi:hypothetical protein